jgi:hypothetical protein
MFPKIIIICVWYGALPVTIKYWLRSLACNKTIDFLLVSDVEIEKKPDNLFCIKLSLSDIKRLAEQKLGMSITLDKPYKLCDFRPAYGVIFSNHIKGYDYWGHCDLDVVWGDLRAFFLKYRITNYDKYLNRGHLTLYRNTEMVNNYFKYPGSQVGDYKTVFTNPLNFGFDETYGINKIFKVNNLPEFNKPIYCDINPRYRRFKQAVERHEDRNYKYQVYYWQNGKIYRAFYHNNNVIIEECLYLHHQKRKYTIDTIAIDSVDRLWLTYSGFFIKQDDVAPSLKEMKKYNGFPGIFYELLETFQAYSSPKKICRKIWRDYLAKYFLKIERFL